MNEPQPSHVNRHTALIIAIVLLLIIIGFLYWFRAPLGMFSRNFAALMSIHGEHIVQGPGIGEKVSTIGFFGEQKVTSKAGRVVDYAHSSKGDFAIILSPDGRDEDVFSLSDMQKITSDGGIKSSLSVSPDGTNVAYAALKPGGYHAFGPSSNIADWSVRIHDVKSSVELVFLGAYQPQFFTSGTSTVVAFMQPDGIMMDNVTTHTVQLVKESGSTSTMSPLYVSPDGKHLLSYDQSKSQYVLYDMSGTFPFTLKPHVPMPPLGHVIGMDNNGIYSSVVSSQAKRADVLYTTFAKPFSVAWTYASSGTALFKMTR